MNSKQLLTVAAFCHCLLQLLIFAYLIGLCPMKPFYYTSNGRPGSPAAWPLLKLVSIEPSSSKRRPPPVHQRQVDAGTQGQLPQSTKVLGQYGTQEGQVGVIG
ncbi:unnamed protein product [Polarella glacialis]|uniref:Uncharacterized protein n=1 Tax=Polarella glacialis TaxID=89957 RepID=A0A813F8N5_POLGL|nr:unnamed protein product [Polarella glacialis]CAE8621768.1 unnamed protein product [Polarella glacialis]